MDFLTLKFNKQSLKTHEGKNILLTLSVRERHDPRLCSKFNLSQTAQPYESLCKATLGLSERGQLWMRWLGSHDAVLLSSRCKFCSICKHTYWYAWIHTLEHTHRNTYIQPKHAHGTCHVGTLAHSDISKERQDTHKREDQEAARLKEFSFCMIAAGHNRAFWVTE